MTKPAIDPSSLYQELVQSKQLKANDAQEHVIDRMQLLHQQITRKKRILRFKRDSHHGLYLWGSVGTGKTVLVDIFLKSLPEKIKHKRYHYHAFMRMVHKQLKELQGQREPIQRLAKKLKKQYDVLFLDEFFIKDMANAIILGDLLKNLFKYQITIIITSNKNPDDLYKNGLFRERFLPAIAAIKSHMIIFELITHYDFRMLFTNIKKIYFFPDTDKSDASLLSIYQTLAPPNSEQHHEINCLGRKIQTINFYNKVIWFDFNHICAIPRSQNDYLELCEVFDIFIISHIPQFNQHDEASNLYFIMLVDVLYDQHKVLIISAAASLQNLIPQDGPQSFVFQRAFSRLNEMQSKSYLQDHLPAN